jgi:hypothetical protein
MKNGLSETEGQSILMFEIWTLSKGCRRAICTLRSHAAGGEVLATVDGEAWLAKSGPDLATLMATADDWKTPFLANGWTP